MLVVKAIGHGHELLIPPVVACLVAPNQENRNPPRIKCVKDPNWPATMLNLEFSHMPVARTLHLRAVRMAQFRATFLEHFDSRCYRFLLVSREGRPTTARTRRCIRPPSARPKYVF